MDNAIKVFLSLKKDEALVGKEVTPTAFGKAIGGVGMDLTGTHEVGARRLLAWLMTRNDRPTDTKALPWARFWQTNLDAALKAASRVGTTPEEVIGLQQGAYWAMLNPANLAPKLVAVSEELAGVASAKEVPSYL